MHRKLRTLWRHLVGSAASSSPTRVPPQGGPMALAIAQSKEAEPRSLGSGLGCEPQQTPNICCPPPPSCPR